VSFQFPRREDDDLGPPPPPFRIRRRRVDFRSFGGYNKWILLAVGLLLLYIVLNTLKGIYVDWMWFDGAGYRSVYSKMIETQAWLFAGGAAIFVVFFGGNVYLAARPSMRSPGPGFSEAEASSLRRVYLLAIIAGTLFFGVIFGTIAASHWNVVLSYLSEQPFGVRDPQFGRDVGFFVFVLPALRFAYGWLMGVAILTTLAASGLYLFRFLSVGSDATTTKQSRVHLSLLLLSVVALFIWRYWLNRYEIDLSQNGVVFGATYADVHARLPFIYAGMALAAVTGVALLVTAFGRSIMLPVGSAIAWVAVSVIGGGAYPASVQRFNVQPNELQEERQYIQRNIDMTRSAFGLDKIDEKQFPAAPAVSEQEINDNPTTISNIRLLDVRPLLQTYSQIQTIRPLYQFLDVDVDRYIINGVARQVMVSARELSSGLLPASAQSWVNKRLQFTHGYGLVMSPVNEVVQEGLPDLFLRDIPVTGSLDVTRPEIYYGEEPDHYVIVKTKDKEFDYPVGEGNEQNVFDGGGGVKVGSIFNRLLFAWQFKDLNILISGSLTSESRILFHRNIQDRLHTIAPFLTLDHDPYLVVSGGRLYWIQDAYTTTNRYPYSQPDGGINYIRNSVKVVVDAYDGTTTFYLVDDTDPIIKTYAKIFPKLFTPLDQMPSDLRAHLRYPEDLFKAQVDQYLTYHITDAGVLYNKEDIWAIPRELLYGQDVAVEPYYVIMRIPGEQSEEFALIQPLTPTRRENTIAWIAARSDGANYGKLISFRFPTNSSVFGPRQIESRIDQDPTISAQISLWNQSGSQVIRGNLLMIPIGTGNLFVEPIYLQASQSQLPELKRVVVVNGNTVAMEPTLERSIAVVLGEAAPTQPTAGTPTASPSPSPTPAGGTPAPTATPAPASPTPAPTGTPAVTAPTGSAADLAQQANAAFERAQAALQRGDFATYGQEIANVQRLIQQLVQVTQGQ
jgi:uncharacterized membrane protein (UPF0182 family)